MFGRVIWVKKVICAALAVVLLGTGLAVMVGASGKNEDYIKYVEYNVCYDAMETAMNADIESQGQEIKIDWIDVLSYLGAKYGGNFKSYKKKDCTEFIEKLKSGEKVEDLTKDMKYFPYYREAYGAVLSGFLGNYREQKNRRGGQHHDRRKIRPVRFFPHCQNVSLFPF